MGLSEQPGSPAEDLSFDAALTSARGTSFTVPASIGERVAGREQEARVERLARVKPLAVHLSSS